MITDLPFHLTSYRPCVGIVLINSSKKIFIGRRKDLDDLALHAWQMPQGGIDPFETIQEAALRELEEEIGTNKVIPLVESTGWIFYDFPPNIKHTIYQGKFLGQRQKWVLYQFQGQDHDINIHTQHPEFCHWKWAPKEDVLTSVIPFKNPIYQNIFHQFKGFL